MARLDNESKELYPGEAKDFWSQYRARQLAEQPATNFRIARVVERKVASGHKVTYKGVLRGKLA